MSSADLLTTIDPEDREIVGKLAKLQNMYSQVSQIDSQLKPLPLHPIKEPFHR
jgi:hypothetical protein